MILFLPAALSLFFSLLFICIPDSAKEIRKAGIFSGLIIFGTALLSCGRGVTLDPVMETFFGWDSFSKLAVILIGFFVMLISVYSAGFLKEKVNRFFSLFFLTAFSAFGIVLSRHWILFTIFWGISGITLYLMMQLEEDAKDAAKKTLVLLGGTDTMLLLAVAVIFNLTGSFAIAESPFHPLAFFFLLSASFAKAGNMPFHTWIPSCAEKAPLPVTAYLPASLDKVLGIYLLMRVFQIFTVPDWARVIVMGLGALTIISAVFMALSQHNGRKLLAYHAVSQVGYMVLGIGTGTVLGMAAGVFHMVNHAIYKSALFLGMGSVEKLRGTDRLEKLGGLARVLPYTFVSMLVAAFSISGIPPLNGFYSKWLIYQSVVEAFRQMPAFQIFIIFFLITALFGSALTLASFVKLIHAIFLGVRNGEHEKKDEPLLFVPQVLLAFLCVLLGIGAQQLLLRPIFGELVTTGYWSPLLAFLLIIAGLVLGGVFYLLAGVAFRPTGTFIGGEMVEKEMFFSGVEFYTTIENINPFRFFYRLSRKGVFDIYEGMKSVLFYFIGILRYFHSGVLSLYLIWIFAGGLIILGILW